MSLSDMMIVGSSIDYAPYITKNPEKAHEIESRYHLRRCRNLLQFIVGLLVVSVVATLLGALAGILFFTVIGTIILGVAALIVLLWGYFKMIKNFSTELVVTNNAEKAELEAL
ncbi:MAG TPA: hypothetical protein O0X42_00160 [Methanocorpusculum sp.]|nr:hypothetical protein [Methanocorpusculum sp.]